MRRLALTVVAVVLAACGKVRVATDLAPADMYVRAPMDAVWQSVIAFFADAHVPIATIEKSSGLIVTRDMELTKDQMRKWIDCGGQGKKDHIDNYVDAFKLKVLGNFSVFVRPMGDSTSARISIGTVAHSDMEWILEPQKNCKSSGVFERELLSAILADARSANPGGRSAITPPVRSEPAPYRAPASSTAPTVGLSWTLSEITDPTDKARVVQITRASENAVGNPPRTAQLSVQCDSGKLFVFAAWGQRIGTGTATIVRRIDTGGAMANAWTLSPDGMATFYPRDVRDLLLEMSGRETLSLQATPSGAQPIAARFSLAGMSDAVRPVLAACQSK